MTNTVIRHNLIESLARPLPELFEGWVDASTIDTNTWTTTDPATGTAWIAAVNGAYLQCSTVPNADEIARLVLNQLFVSAPDTYGTNTIYRKLYVEFECQFANVANIDNANSFFGLTAGTTNTRTSNNIVGWALTSDALQSVTDDAATETTNTTFGETLTNWNKLKIVVSKGHVRFYINETEKANHITNLPDVPMYLNFYIDTEGGGTATFRLGAVRVWYEDFI